MKHDRVVRCRRCRERDAVFRTGPLLGLCKTCLENDHIGMSAEIEVLESNAAALLEKLRHSEEQVALHKACVERLSDVVVRTAGVEVTIDDVIRAALREMRRRGGL